MVERRVTCRDWLQRRGDQYDPTQNPLRALRTLSALRTVRLRYVPLLLSATGLVAGGRGTRGDRCRSFPQDDDGDGAGPIVRRAFAGVRGERGLLCTQGVFLEWVHVPAKGTLLHRRCVVPPAGMPVQSPHENRPGTSLPRRHRTGLEFAQGATSRAVLGIDDASLHPPRPCYPFDRSSSSATVRGHSSLRRRDSARSL